MAMVRCAAGIHFFNDELYSDCPTCRSLHSGQGKTKVVAPGGRPAPPRSSPEDDDATHHEFVGEEPVVGWLVCIKGAAWGKDFPIRSGRNGIGRGAGPRTRIRIVGDQRISREEQAVIFYEPRAALFTLDCGRGDNLSYLNDEAVYRPTPLTRGDCITLGGTVLAFVPFCDADFRWTMEDG